MPLDETDERGPDALWAMGPPQPLPPAPRPVVEQPAPAPWTMGDDAAPAGPALPRAAGPPASPFTSPARQFNATMPLPPVASPRREKRSIGRIVGAVIAAVVVAAVAVAVVAVWRADDLTSDTPATDELPRFDGPRPIYGTATVDITLEGLAEAFRMTMVSDSTNSVLYAAYVPESPTYAGYQMLANDAATFAMAPGDSTWTLVENGDELAFGPLKPVIGVTTFADWIPEVVRSYTSVASDSTELLDGRSVRRLELIVSSAKLRTDHPAEYAGWIGSDPEFGPDSPPLSRLVLSVDDQGIVRKMETWANVGDTARLTIALTSYVDEAFAPEFPTTYIDETNGGVLVGG